MSSYPDSHLTDAHRPAPGTSAYGVADDSRRSRLTTLLRFFLLIPHFVGLFVYGIVAFFAVIVAWFAILVTGRYPAGLFSLVAGFNRYAARVSGALYLLTDVYPGFNGAEAPEYPVRLVIGEPKEQYSRVLTLFRVVLYIPVYVVTYCLSVVSGIVAVLSWIVIIITGRQPAALQNVLVFCLGYTARGYAYFCLLTEQFPPFDNGEVSFPASDAVTTTPGGFAPEA